MFATIASGTVDIPTTSAPRVRSIRISAGVSQRRSWHGGINTAMERYSEPASLVVGHLT